MKSSIYLLLVMLFCFACQRKKSVGFIPGIYICHAEDDYSVADDTLLIRALEGNHYEILRKTGFYRIEDGKPGERERETELWHGLYNVDAGVLNETRYGKVISFYPDSGNLRVGAVVYKKIK